MGKYLADFQEDMSLEKCKKTCSDWQNVCNERCKKKKECALSDAGDARHFSREESCSKKCVGFNMHPDGHCTLFAENVELNDGGKGTYYVAPGAEAPKIKES